MVQNVAYKLEYTWQENCIAASLLTKAYTCVHENYQLMMQLRVGVVVCGLYKIISTLCTCTFWSLCANVHNHYDKLLESGQFSTYQMKFLKWCINYQFLIIINYLSSAVRTHLAIQKYICMYYICMVTNIRHQYSS